MKQDKKSYQEFLETSKYYVKNIHAFIGFFYVDNTHCVPLYEIYLESGKNLIDEYVEVIHLSWDCDKNDIYFDSEDIVYNRRILSSIRNTRVLDLDTMYDAIITVDNGYNNYRKRREKEFNRPRREAQSFIQKKEVRDYIFDKYGKKCLCCGDEENISLDHIIPIFHSGKNELDNLQPLCRSCNSRKGTKTIDYRKGGKNV